MHSVETDGPVTELGEFLRSRRDRMTPEEAGVNSYGRRRVPGLRREELAQLAGVSVAYLTRLEQGQSQKASDAIIDSLARALHLDADERAHLYTLAHPATVKRASMSKPEDAKPGVEQLLHAMGDVPALLLGRFNDILAWNRAGHLLLAGHLNYDAPSQVEDRPNQMKLLFLDEHTRDLYADWADEAAVAVASLRYVAAQFSRDRHLAALVGELSMNSPDFVASGPGTMCACAPAAASGSVTRRSVMWSSATRYCTCLKAMGSAFLPIPPNLAAHPSLHCVC